jgi:acetyl-CoA carboxylase biotin carboxyl carrier protein
MSKGTEQDVAFIQALAQLLRESDLTELEVKRDYGEGDELKIRLARAPNGMAPVATPLAPVLSPHLPQGAAPHASLAAARLEDEAPDLSNAVTSPMVGTAYLAPEPGSDNFVSVGDEVSEGDTILIIEAMKTMNHIPAPRTGKVRAVLVDNAEPVEFGEPLMIIE